MCSLIPGTFVGQAPLPTQLSFFTIATYSVLNWCSMQTTHIPQSNKALSKEMDLSCGQNEPNSFSLLMIPQTELAMRGSNGLGKGPWKVTAATRRSFWSGKTSTWWHLLSSRLDETGGRELKHQYLQEKINIYWSRWPLRPVGHKTSGPGHISGNLETGN